MPETQKESWGLVGIILVSCLLTLFGLHEGHSWGGDFAMYIAQGQAMVAGNSQQLAAANHLSMSRSAGVLGPDMYPPGFPVLMAGVYLMRGLDLLAMKIPGCIALIGTYLLIYQLFSRHLQHGLSRLSMVAIFGWNPYFIQTPNLILADLPFMFCCLLFLQLLLIWERRAYPVGWGVLLGLTAASSILLRSHGWVLLPVWAIQVWILSERQAPFSIKASSPEAVRKIFPAILTLGLVFLASVGYPFQQAHYLTFLDRVSWESLGRNLWFYAKAPGALYGSWLAYLWYPLTLPFLVAGLKGWKREETLFLVFTGGYMAVLWIWPFIEGLRFVQPVLPVMVFFFLKGVERVVGHRKTRRVWARGVLSVLVFSLMGESLYRTWEAATEAPGNEVMRPPTQALFEKVSALPSEDGWVVFAHPRILRLFTGKNGFMLTDTAAILRSKADYYIERKGKDPSLPGTFAVLFENKAYRLYLLSPQP